LDSGDGSDDIDPIVIMHSSFELKPLYKLVREKSVGMDPFVPAEFIQCTTVKIKENGEVLDYTDEESPHYKEPFLQVMQNAAKKELLDISNHVVATLTNGSTIHISLTTGGMQELSLNDSTLHCHLGTFDVTPAPPSFCCGGGGSISYDINLHDKQVAQFQESTRTKSTQIDFLGKDPKEKLFAVLLVVHRMFFE
jgi:hypothetical protein